jgi:hypothetical protein
MGQLGHLLTAQPGDTPALASGETDVTRQNPGTGLTKERPQLFSVHGSIVNHLSRFCLGLSLPGSNVPGQGLVYPSS